MTAPLTTGDGRLGRAHGYGAVRGAARGPVATLVGRAFGLRPGRPVPAELRVVPGPDGDDRWTRRFGRRRWTTTCTPTATGFVEWIGPGSRHHLLGLDLAAAFAPGGEATLRLRALRVRRWRLRPPPGLAVTATVTAGPGGLAFASTTTVAGWAVLAYEGWIR